jgi:hypothetical protein
MTTPGFPEQRRQPDPQPAKLPASNSPSLILYAALLIFGIGFLFLARASGGIDWSGFFINLSAGIFQTILILIFVEERIRQSEVYLLQEYATTTWIRLAQVFSRDIATTVSYAQTYGRQLEKILPVPYIDLLDPEDLLEKYPEGFILYGRPGTGKTVLAQVLANRQTKRVVRAPFKTPIPIFMRGSYFIPQHHSFKDLLYREASKFGDIKRKIFERWIHAGRIFLIIDALDETINIEALLQEIRNIKAQYPSVYLVLISSTNHSQLLAMPPGGHQRVIELIDKLELPKVDMPGLTEKQAEELFRGLTGSPTRK